MFKLFASRDKAVAHQAWSAPQPSNATQADLVACFRLLLGRAPHRAEWPMHTDKIGRDLRTVVASFILSQEFAQSGLLPPPLAGAMTMATGNRVDTTATVATVEDIYFCFRLILGRPPNPEEWQGHSTQVGNDLARVVAGYTNSLEFARRDIAHPGHQGNISLTQQDGFQIYAAEDDAAVGRHIAAGAYEPDVTAVFRRSLRPGMSVIDIGANIGFFAMLSASLVGQSGRVLAVEPNPRNARMLEASRRANGFDHLTLCQVAAGRETGILVLNTSHSNGTTSSASDNLERLLSAETVACVKIDALVDPDTRVDFIKVDVEGAEYNALLGCHRIMEKCRPVIVTEFSPDMIGSISGISGPDYLRWLISMGYDLAVIQPDGSAQPMAGDFNAVMNAYGVRGTDHIDILATPV